jgi:hypothetical protein
MAPCCRNYSIEKETTGQIGYFKYKVLSTVAQNLGCPSSKDLLVLVGTI